MTQLQIIEDKKQITGKKSVITACNVDYRDSDSYEIINSKILWSIESAPRGFYRVKKNHGVNPKGSAELWRKKLLFYCTIFQFLEYDLYCGLVNFIIALGTFKSTMLESLNESQYYKPIEIWKYWKSNMQEKIFFHSICTYY